METPRCECPNIGGTRKITDRKVQALSDEVAGPARFGFAQQIGQSGHGAQRSVEL